MRNDRHSYSWFKSKPCISINRSTRKVRNI
nr:MAG TPA: hypothetical protein [Caudoviricetes sp.]